MKTLQETILLNTRFGAISYRPDEVLSFPDGLVGFSGQESFLLISSGEGSPFQWLQSLSTPELAFLVADPGYFLADYRPFELGDGDLLLTTVTIPQGRPEEMTLNLAGPILIGLSSHSGCQIVLEDEAYTTKYRVFAKAAQEIGDLAA